MEQIISLLAGLFILILVARKIFSIDSTQQKIDQTNEHLKNISEKLDVLITTKLREKD